MTEVLVKYDVLLMWLTVQVACNSSIGFHSKLCVEEWDEVLIVLRELPLELLVGGGGGGGPTTFLYMATRFLPNVHVQNVQKCTKYVFSCLEVPWIDLLAVANLK